MQARVLLCIVLLRYELHNVGSIDVDGRKVQCELTLQNLLKRISSENRVVEPSNVWLMLIPLFNLVYAFILYPKISESLKNEFLKRGLADSGDYGKSLGTAMAVLGLCGFIPIFGGFASIAHLVIWIIYWVKMSEYKSKLS